MAVDDRKNDPSSWVGGEGVSHLVYCVGVYTFTIHALCVRPCRRCII